MMHRITIRLAPLLFLVLFQASLSVAANKYTCAECGMLVDENSRFTARIAGETMLHFCDIGDLLIYMKSKKLSTTGAQVKDYVSGEWIEASAAFYVHAPKRFSTPMGWSVAAFREKDAAQTYGSPLDFGEMTAALK